MAQIQVTVNGRAYSVACDDGQEEHVGRLARHIERQVAGLVDAVGQVGDARLLLMASLILADELADAELELARSEPAPPGTAERSPAAALRAEEALLCRTLDGLAGRLEAIAVGLDRA